MEGQPPRKIARGETLSRGVPGQGQTNINYKFSVSRPVRSGSDHMMSLFFVIFVVPTVR